MAVPKQKQSKARSAKRFAQNSGATAKNVNVCEKCGEVKRAFYACPKCGYYDKNRSVPIKAEKDKADKK